MPTDPTDRDPAPAITRGLRLLAYLNTEGASSLDRLAKATGWPKASVLRLLRSMEGAGAVVRDDSSKRWRSLLRLMRGGQREDLVRAACGEPSLWLCKAVRQTAEVYVFENGRLEMIDRSEPDGVEVTVRARVGFVRTWDEADAVVLTGLAFGFNGAWPSARHWIWHGRAKVALPRAELEPLVSRARARGVIGDAEPNPNGVRRFAAPVLDHCNQLVGVLAIATPSASPEVDERLSRLVASAARRASLAASDDVNRQPRAVGA